MMYVDETAKRIRISNCDDMESDHLNTENCHNDGSCNDVIDYLDVSGEDTDQEVNEDRNSR